MQAIENWNILLAWHSFDSENLIAESILKRFDSDFMEVSSARSAYLSLRADLAYRNGDNESAIVWLERLLSDEEATGEDRLELYARLGVVLYAAGKVDRALAICPTLPSGTDAGKLEKANHLKRTDRAASEPTVVG